MYSILLIEDDVDIHASIVHLLRKEGFNVLQAYDGEAGLRIFETNSVDLILLDMMLPKIHGEQVLRAIRSLSDVPVIVISALTDELVQYNAFENRVDDYVVKPFSMNILNYKIKAILRRIGKVQGSVLNYEKLSVHVDAYYATYDGDEITLTTKEFEMLQLLLMNPGRVYSREEMLTLLWGYDYYGDMRNIDVHIKNLRKKIVVDCIRTIKGVGYRIDKNGSSL